MLPTYGNVIKVLFMETTRPTNWFFCGMVYGRVQREAAATEGLAGFGTIAARRNADGAFDVYFDGNGQLVTVSAEIAAKYLRAERFADRKLHTLHSSQVADIARRARIAS